MNKARRLGLSLSAMLAPVLLFLLFPLRPAAAGAVIYAFDPPPAHIAPIAASILARAEADPVVTAARAAVAAKDGKTAFAQYQKAVAAGNVVAMVELADLQNRSNGVDVPVDMQNAELLYQRAALAGYTKAMRRFGGLYWGGDGVAKDLSRACAWYAVAAEDDDEIADGILAMDYAIGDDIAVDAVKALHYAEQGEKLNGRLARSILGFIYLQGVGVPRDPARGFYLTFLAAQQGEMMARFRLVQLYHSGIGIAVDQGQAEHWEDVAEHTPTPREEPLSLFGASILPPE